MKTPEPGPLVSILIPSYNHRGYIEQSITSAIKQTYKNIEVIVCDDGSKDGSREFLRELSTKVGFTYLENEKNMGVSATLNKLLHKSRGDLICPIASDDISFLDKIERQVAFLSENKGVDVVFGRMVEIDGDGKTLREYPHLNGGHLDFDYVLKNYGGVSTPTAMIRRSTLEAVGGWKEGIAMEDLYMWLKITSRGGRLFDMNDQLVYYRAHDSNAHKNVDRMLTAFSAIMDEYKKYPAARKAANRYKFGYFKRAAEDGDLALAKKIFSMIDLSYRPAKKIKIICCASIRYSFKKH